MAYDANIAAPLIVSLPGTVMSDQVCEEPVNGLDIVRTFHRLAGIEPVMEMHGRDLSPLLKDPSKKLGEPLLLTHTARVYGETFLEHIKNGDWVGQEPKPAWLMLRDGKFKYIRHMQEDTIEELYDLEADPEELTNLSVNPEYGSILRSLRRKAADEVWKKDGEFVDYLPKPKGA